MLKKILIYLIVSLLLSLLINRFYEHHLRPDSLFFSDCLTASRQWETKVRKQGEPCYVFAGGSEVRMSIEPIAMLKEQGVRAINAATHAGNGIRCNIQIALDFLQRGDTLVLSMFPDVTTVGENSSHGGVNFCYTQQGSKMFADGIVLPNAYNISHLLFGDSSCYSTHILRILTRPRCIYRYSCKENARISESGRVEVFIRKTHISPSKSPQEIKKTPIIHFSGIASLIEQTKRACHTRGANLIVYLPRHCRSSIFRQTYAQTALYLTKLGIPVLRDPHLGTWENNDAYSDTPQHMSIQGGQVYSAYIAQLLKNKDYWTQEELLHIIHAPSDSGQHPQQSIFGLFHHALSPPKQ